MGKEGVTAPQRLERNLLLAGAWEEQMSTATVQRKASRNAIDLPSAALLAGYSSRQFRKIIEEDNIPVVQIGNRSFIEASDLEEWKATRGEARLDQLIKQLDGWMKS
jgi:hypothetical protein